MAKFITLGVYTAKGLAGFVDNPETDRKAATSALAAAAGAKLTRYAGLRGKYDFMAEMEGTFDQCAAAAMVAVSSGAVPDLIKQSFPITTFLPISTKFPISTLLPNSEFSLIIT